MPKLPVISGRETVRIFEQHGWVIARQRGSHIVMIREGSLATLSIPDYEEIAKGTLRGLIRVSGMSVQEFLRASRKR